MTDSRDKFPGRILQPVWCDGCGARIRSQIHRHPVDGTHQFCHGCLSKIRADDLNLGEDFEAGELWTSEEVTPRAE